MAAIAPGLNFRIGADVKGVNKAIREAGKSLRGAVSSFSSIGTSLSLALSAPLTAFGALSVKAAGDMESLRFALEGTMKDAGRSVSDARAELEELRKAALAPGLDFEQAVRGSVRLQSVGYQAEEARRIIVQLANALALSGGTADQLDGVTKQFTQMIGKGKIMQEDLSIILENMPSLAKVMRQEFGTANAEMLRDMGVGVTDFISRLTAGMEKLPRAQGGIANAIVNAQNAVKQAIAGVGEEINRVFNVSGKLQAFADWVSGLVTWFKGLDDSTKRAIGAVATFAVALGPATFAMGKMVQMFGALQVVGLNVRKALFESLAGQIPSFIAKWRAMDAVMKASVIGGIAAVVLAAAAAFAVFSKDMSHAAQAARAVQATQEAASASIAIERAEIEALTSIAGNETKSKEERLKAMNRLIEISPDYRKSLNGETIDTQKLTDTTRALVDSMLKAATAKRAVEDIAAIDEQIRNLGKNSDPSFWQSAGNALLSFNNSAVFAARQAGSSAKNYTEQRAALEATRTELMKLAEANVFAFGATKTGTDLTKDSTVANKEAKNALDAYLETVKKNEEAQRKWNEARAAMGISTLETLPQAETALPGDGLGVGAMMEGFSGMDEALANVQGFGAGITAALTPAQAVMQALQRETMTFNEVFDATAKAVQENGTMMQQVIFAAADSIAQSGAQGASSLKDFAKAAIGAAAKVIRSWIQMAVARAALSALQNVPFPFNIAAAAAAGGLAAGLFNGLIQKVGIPALAEGGVLTGPQLVMAGEYPGARINPEIVTPENKMRDVFGEVLSRAGGVGGGTLTCRISGDDLLFVLEKASNKAARRR